MDSLEPSERGDIEGTGQALIDNLVVAVKNGKVVQAGVESDVDTPVLGSVVEVNTRARLVSENRKRTERA